MFEFSREATAVSVPGLLLSPVAVARKFPNVAVLTEDRAFALFFRPTPGHLTVQQSPPPGICHPRQKKKIMMLMPGGQPGGWGFWAQMELTDASQRRQQVNWVWIRPILI